jgi:hypothetical protein
MKQIIFGFLIIIIVSCGRNIKTSDNSKFIWDFRESKDLIYSYSQTGNREIKKPSENSPSKSSISISGNLKINIKDNEAELSLFGTEQKRIDYDVNGNPLDTLSFKEVPQIRKGMKPDGSFSDSVDDITFEILFPKLSENLQIGEKYKVKLQMTLSVDSSKLVTTGFNTLEFTGFENINKRECAVLIGSFNISDMNVPDVLTGKIRNTMEGEAIYYFDLKDKIYVGADIKMRNDTFWDIETVGKDKQGYWEGKVDSSIKIRLEKIV